MTSNLVGRCYYLAFMALIVAKDAYDIWTYGFVSPYQITGIAFSILFSFFIMAYAFEIPVSTIMSRIVFTLSMLYAGYLLVGNFGNTQTVIHSLWKVALFLPGYFMLFQLSAGLGRQEQEREVDPIVEKLRQPAPWERTGEDEST